MNRRASTIYLAILLAVVGGWLVVRHEDVLQGISYAALPSILGACALYLGSHLFRMLRLLLLTLDDRHHALPLMMAHALTAFPSSLLPFKIGEALRLASFYHVYGYQQKALAVWLMERFGDIAMLALIISGFALLERNLAGVPRSMLGLAVLGLSLGMFCLLSLSKLLHYISRQLVLTGQRQRDLALLRISNIAFRLELDIRKSIAERWAGFLLLSAFIWAMEILAFSCFLRIFQSEGASLGDMFSDAFLSGLSLTGADFSYVFEMYRSCVLIAFTLVVAAFLLLSHPKKSVGG